MFKRSKPNEREPFPWLDWQDRFDFPNPRQAPGDAPLAQGGNLSPGMLLSAYSQGIFPWFSQGQPILWWSPDPRFVIFPQKVHVSASMRKVLRQRQFRISYDTNFEQVIQKCAKTPRPGQAGTWIVQDMIQAYCRLHQGNFAHSVEVWQDDALVGGLYGVLVGGVFCGESMFSLVSNASKVGFLSLARHLRDAGIAVIDSQVHTKYLESLGAEHIARQSYLDILQTSQPIPKLAGAWTNSFGEISDW